MALGSAALGAALGWILGYRRGQRAAWEVALRAAGPTEEEKTAAAAAMKNKATRWAKTGEQLRAARVGEKRTKIPKRRRVDMVDWPEPSQGPKDKERRGSRSATEGHDDDDSDSIEDIDTESDEDDPDIT